MAVACQLEERSIAVLEEIGARNQLALAHAGYGRLIGRRDAESAPVRRRHPWKISASVVPVPLWS